MLEMATIELITADITEQDVDAIVNAANSLLSHGGGVAAAIAEAGGGSLTAESDAAPFVPIGDATFTSGGDLPCEHVIHAVGPVWRGGHDDEAELLAMAYRRALTIAEELACKTIAFPSISTGIFGFPVDLAAPIAIRTVNDFLSTRGAIELVRFCLFSNEDLEIYCTAAERESVNVATA